ncbi:MAG: HAMP domain-containing protein [Deltaproteobacteria bacterium]|nr:HAMP domain-containing protein [Deltaproteobacteria bacterium]
MKISFKRKIILHFPVFMIISLFALVLSSYSHYVLNQKLQITEMKNNLFNIILEARRFEKNYFLHLSREHLEKARFYAGEAKIRLYDIIENYGKYTLAKNLDEMAAELVSYEKSLSRLVDLHEKDGRIKVTANTLDNFQTMYKEIEAKGRKITTKFEKIVTEERKYFQNLIKKSRIYHTIALSTILILSVLTTLFLIINVNRPLSSIEDAVYKIARGQFSNIPRLSTGDEFESLVNSVNIMINELNIRNEQIVQSEKLASLGTLTSGVAHELNNPLNNISTSIQILIEETGESLPEFQRKLLIEAEKQVERARDTVKALLEFSRDRTFSPDLINFKELVEQTIKLTKSEMPSAIKLNVDVSEDLKVNVDPQRIQQVLINLIMNAVHAMEGGGELSIRAYALEGNRKFCFQVHDTGIGIPKESLSKIFDPFFTTKEIGVGTGLGLSTTHGIVEQHGGKIEVKSEVGKGTTFSVYLPHQ